MLRKVCFLAYFTISFWMGLYISHSSKMENKEKNYRLQVLFWLLVFVHFPFRFYFLASCFPSRTYSHMHNKFSLKEFYVFIHAQKERQSKKIRKRKQKLCSDARTWQITTKFHLNCGSLARKLHGCHMLLCKVQTSCYPHKHTHRETWNRIWNYDWK